ncbi:hypothetical protein TVAG_174790 [Trichomonas vaginalis G3]|uniref:Uncharacterized protein n=1 Tax=Trichomonas vaginalis (strain ATCC PRA-98 / G3) TaxID=412133 RepID=A2EK25_TRIV3|nr:hypothetical protein TVAGG3_0974270 [Trichomonas vaginalis G3]EAY07009.1 hypothetical protein TVAG_174790 [Trichomonas vaginalis G3]KAI5488811.1 hypothetical protein TVAGG3_0974270 [Trichomonas vaginalis G3]|eukprot:XP_001319232.1 hypothetical protein [Trichomonas vaginalis G3]
MTDDMTVKIGGTLYYINEESQIGPAISVKSTTSSSRHINIEMNDQTYSDNKRKLILVRNGQQNLSAIAYLNGQFVDSIDGSKYIPTPAATPMYTPLPTYKYRVSPTESSKKGLTSKSKGLLVVGIFIGVFVIISVIAIYFTFKKKKQSKSSSSSSSKRKNPTNASILSDFQQQQEPYPQAAYSYQPQPYQQPPPQVPYQQPPPQAPYYPPPQQPQQSISPYQPYE